MEAAKAQNWAVEPQEKKKCVHQVEASKCVSLVHYYIYA
jgi:hypothetical protein